MWLNFPASSLCNPLLGIHIGLFFYTKKTYSKLISLLISSDIHSYATFYFTISYMGLLSLGNHTKPLLTAINHYKPHGIPLMVPFFYGFCICYPYDNHDQTTLGCHGRPPLRNQQRRTPRRRRRPPLHRSHADRWPRWVLRWF